MNRVFFLILLIAFLVVPLSINNVNDDGISYFDLVVEISENLFEDLKIEEKDEISLSKDQKQVINEDEVFSYDLITLDIDSDDLIRYGNDKAKLSTKIVNSLSKKKNGKFQ